MLNIYQSDANHNPCEAVFLLASAAYKAEDVIPQTQLERWWQQYPGLFYLAFDNDSLCGYISAFPLTQEAFAKTLEPDFDEKELEPLAMARSKAKENYQMYFSSIVVHPNWRGKGISKALRKAFLNNLISLWCEGKCVTQLSSVVVSPKGVTMMKSLGMKCLKDGKQGAIFYTRHTEKSLQEQLMMLSYSSYL